MAYWVTAPLADAAEPACGEGVSPDPDPPAVSVLFPPLDSATGEATIIVRGAASDPDSIAAIRVDGQLATSTDGFVTFQAEVALAPGSNQVVIASEDRSGFVTAEAVCATFVRQGPTVQSARDIIWDSAKWLLSPTAGGRPSSPSTCKPASG